MDAQEKLETWLAKRERGGGGGHMPRPPSPLDQGLVAVQSEPLSGAAAEVGTSLVLSLRLSVVSPFTTTKLLSIA